MLGITNDVRDVNLLTFRPTEENPFNLAILKEVKLEFYKVKEESKTFRDYVGLELPSIVMHFCSPARKDMPNARVHNYVHRFFMIEQTNNAAETAKYNSLFQSIKHIYTTFAQFPEKGITVADARTKKVKQADGSVVEELIQASPEAMIDMFTNLFTLIVNMFNTGRDGKPVYQDEKGANIPVWLKLIVSHDGSRLEFPGFPGEGFIERAIPSGTGFAKTNLEFAIIRGEKESIVKKPKTKTVIVPGANAGVAGIEDLPSAPF